MNNNIKSKDSYNAFSFLFNAIKPFKFYLSLHFFVIIWMAIDVSLWPYISKILIDKLAVTKPENVISEVWFTALILMILTALPAFIWRLSDYSWAKMNPRLKKSITTQSMNYIMQHSHNFFQNRFTEVKFYIDPKYVIEENFNTEFFRWNGKNIYWLDENLNVIRSVQTIHPNLSEISIDYFYKY